MPPAFWAFLRWFHQRHTPLPTWPDGVFQMAHAHAAHAYDRFGNSFAGRRLAFADDVARTMLTVACSYCTTGELTTTEFVLRNHKAAEKSALLAVEIKYSNVPLGNSPEERPVVAGRILADLGGHFYVECGTFVDK